MRSGINGAGRVGHQLVFDSVHGRWREIVHASEKGLVVGEQTIPTSRQSTPTSVARAQAGVERVLEGGGRFKTADTLEPSFSDTGLNWPWPLPSLSCCQRRSGA